ncbi:MAG: GFA family protein [Alphaproteobacteria bacterium]|nr:GFA family protein [Alphaproteobacteria bacterium]
MEGSCLCGAVAYRCGDLLSPIVNCHCRTCRKAHSAAFNTAAKVARADFRWTKGGDVVAAYESSPGKLRRFCPRCGSHIVAEYPDQDLMVLRIGSVDKGLEASAAAHIWMSHAAHWDTTTDGLPKFSEGPGSAPFKG